MAKNNDNKGVSLAKGPVLLVGLALLVFGVLALLLGGATSFSADPPSGTVSGTKFLGLEVNGWSSLLFIVAGALLVFGAPLHWGAKGMSILVAIVLGAAAVIGYLNSDSVLGIFAANGLTELVWLIAAVLLLVLALLPRVGGGKQDERAPRRERERPVERERVVERVIEREPDERTEPADRSSRGSRETDRDDRR